MKNKKVANTRPSHIKVVQYQKLFSFTCLLDTTPMETERQLGITVSLAIHLSADLC